MLWRGPLFEYRAWPSRGMHHSEALHHMLGYGVSEIRVDTYILSPSRAHWLMIVRGGTQFEIKVKTGVQEFAAAWETPIRTEFPLRQNVVRMLQDAFPISELPDRISAPADLISWLGGYASIYMVRKRMVHFVSGGCKVELAQVQTHGRQAETFCLKAKRYGSVAAALAMIPGPRLPNVDYGPWLKRQVLGAPPPAMALVPSASTQSTRHAS